MKATLGRGLLLVLGGVIGAYMIHVVSGSGVERERGKADSQRAFVFHEGGRFSAGRSSLSPKESKALEMLGYLAGSRKASVAQRGVTVSSEGKAFPGFNFFVDGSGPRAYLVDMEGASVYTWTCPVDRAFPASGDYPKDATTGFWRRAQLLTDGSVIAVFDGFGIIRIDLESQVIWAVANRAHHDFHVLPDGSIWLLTREEEVIRRFGGPDPVCHDRLVLLSSDGRVLKSLSVLELLVESPYSGLLNSVENGNARDLFHTNTIEVLRGAGCSAKDPFRGGNILLSLRNVASGYLIIVNPEKEEVVWALSGPWVAQHQPEFLETGNILVFDNLGGREGSRVIEFDPVTQEIEWVFDGGSNRETFSSPTCGSVQRLENGNTLVTVTDESRAIEVTPQGEIVWEFFTPNRANDDRTLIASLFELVRIPPSGICESITRKK